MVYKDVKDLDAKLYTLRSSRQIVAPDHELAFTSWDDYSKTIRAIEQATGSVTEALEATVVYLTIIAYSENEKDKNSVTGSMMGMFDASGTRIEK